jgi:A/G-specific adenine glycosylase
MLGLPTSDWRAAPLPKAEALADAPRAASWRRLGEIEHTFTHFALTLDIYRAETAAAGPELIWLPVDRALAETPSVFGKALRLAMPIAP